MQGDIQMAKLVDKIKRYCSGRSRLNAIQEKEFLSNINLQHYTGVNLSRNSGKLSEWYVGQLLKEKGIKYLQQPTIKYGKGKRYLQPDFYIPSKNLFVEVKSRTYNCGGTTSEKIDHAARKYSTKLELTKDYIDAKVLIVFCAGELFEETTVELINHNNPKSSRYVKEFVEFTKQHSVLDWIDVNDIHDYI
jgi:hypothetical protein